MRDLQEDTLEKMEKIKNEWKDLEFSVENILNEEGSADIDDYLLGDKKMKT